MRLVSAPAEETGALRLYNSFGF